MTYVFGPPVVVPAIPPQPPQITLLGSSINPSNASDNPTGDRTTDLISRLSAEMKSELAQHKADSWVRGFTYAPENHYAVENRDPQDFTSVDLPALPAPSNVAAVAVAGGTLVAGTYSYEVTAVNPNGETTISSAASVVTGSTGSVKVTWNSVADDCTYNVYGRTTGSHLKLTPTAVGPFDPNNPPVFVDTGSASPSGSAPGSNTTGGVGPYTNLAPVQVQPWLIVAEDFCSTFGFEARDFKGRALRLLQNAAPQAIEREFWTGALAQAKGYPNNYLASSNAVDLTAGTPVSIARGQQMLQDYLANTGFGGQGMIHCQPQTAPNLLNARRVGNLLLDIYDNIIVPGSGYPGTASVISGTTTGTAVMFATDLVATRTESSGSVTLLDEGGHVYPDTFAEAVDRGQAGFPNSVRFRAQQFGCAYWDGYIQAGVRVTLTT